MATTSYFQGISTWSTLHGTCVLWGHFDHWPSYYDLHLKIPVCCIALLGNHTWQLLHIFRTHHPKLGHLCCSVILTIWPSTLKLWPSPWTLSFGWIYGNHIWIYGNHIWKLHHIFRQISIIQCKDIFTFWPSTLKLIFTLTILSSALFENYKWQHLHILWTYQPSMGPVQYEVFLTVDLDTMNMILKILWAPLLGSETTWQMLHISGHISLIWDLCTVGHFDFFTFDRKIMTFTLMTEILFANTYVQPSQGVFSVNVIFWKGIVHM